MRYRCHRRPRMAMALICGCALVSLYLFQHKAWHAYATEPCSVPEQFVARYEPLRPLVPATAVTGFLADQRHIDAAIMHPKGRLYLAQYALAPRRLADCTASRLVIVESDCPEIAPEIATSAHWTLLADLRNGVRLYRTGVKE